MPKRRKSLRSRLTFGTFTLVLSVLVVAAVAWATWKAWQYWRAEFPEVSRLKTHYPVVIYKGPKAPFEVKLQKSRPGSWVSLNEISREAVGAIVVSEDWAFWQHKGYDPKQLKEAIQEGIESGKLGRGASTITQQVVKNVFLERDRSLWRKMRELVLAMRLEEQVGKRRILETYMNVAEWGEGIFGIGPAARFYFGKAPSQLTAKEGAFLAMLLPSPKRYSQSFRKHALTDYARRTVNSILEKMVQARFLEAERMQAERGTPLSFEIPSMPVPVEEPEGELPQDRES
jgi:monofunctional biosynthetic peptidoglycan transglycosylase